MKESANVGPETLGISVEEAAAQPSVVGDEELDFDDEYLRELEALKGLEGDDTPAETGDRMQPASSVQTAAPVGVALEPDLDLPELDPAADDPLPRDQEDRLVDSPAAELEDLGLEELAEELQMPEELDSFEDDIEILDPLEGVEEFTAEPVSAVTTAPSPVDEREAQGEPPGLEKLEELEELEEGLEELEEDLEELEEELDDEVAEMRRRNLWKSLSSRKGLHCPRRRNLSVPVTADTMFRWRISSMNTPTVSTGSLTMRPGGLRRFCGLPWKSSRLPLR